MDDNRANVAAALALGWARCVHFNEAASQQANGLVEKLEDIDRERFQATTDGIVEIGDLEELRVIWQDIFK